MLHVGNARTALFDWLFARRAGGTCLLRIEDSDESRNHPEWVDVIYRSLEWLGLDWDEEPRFQSASMEQHRATAEKLHAGGHAYFCECTAEEVKARNEAAGNKTPGYDSFCADRGLAPGPGRALRFRVPEEGTIRRVDIIRGEVDIDLATVEDFVILRANGSPLYVLANALDDVNDRITHVLRGEDHLPNVVKQILIRRALGEPEPHWAHLPMIVNEQRKKLSKRRDKVSLESYRDDGFVAEAMTNYLATLGWAPPSELGDELATLAAMVDAFALEDVTSSPAAFDMKKLLSFNGFYLRRMPLEQFVARARPFFSGASLDAMAEHVQTRVERLADVAQQLEFFELEDFDSDFVDKDAWLKATTKAPALAIVDDALTIQPDVWSADDIRRWLDEAAARHEVKSREVHAIVRVSVTGRGFGPPLFESLEVLGREQTLARLRSAREWLSA